MDRGGQRALHAACDERIHTLEDELDKATTGTKATDGQLDWLRGRASTLEAALRPLVATARCWHQDSVAGPVCTAHLAPWPCKYETARRALEGET